MSERRRQLDCVGSSCGLTMTSTVDARQALTSRRFWMSNCAILLIRTYIRCHYLCPVCVLNQTVCDSRPFRFVTAYVTWSEAYNSCHLLCFSGVCLSDDYTVSIAKYSSSFSEWNSNVWIGGWLSRRLGYKASNVDFAWLCSSIHTEENYSWICVSEWVRCCAEKFGAQRAVKTFVLPD